ncbi:MAG: helix-turn-helix transcriptional regulator [Candidatus Caenarcaniphilales bacterium]|nr:helix-turn-helix transcriptional regulator [Candidatus Caenarcaniphilales bacterium]
MQLQGKIWKEDKFWLIEIPALDLISSGKTKAEVSEMLIDAVKILMTEYKLGPARMKLKINKDVVYIQSSNLKGLFALVLRRLRGSKSQKSIAEKLKLKSNNSYQQYELGKREPSISQMEQLLKTLNPNSEITLSF